jgi:flagellar hook-associated protein 2
VARSTTSLASLGLDIQLDGTMQFNTASYQNSVASGRVAKLATGLKVGYLGETSNLDNYIKAQIDNSKGTLVSEINQQQNAITRLQEKKVDLQDHINQIQNNYISQYSALNALLFQLSSTSTSLASALTAITNINAGK